MQRAAGAPLGTRGFAAGWPGSNHPCDRRPPAPRGVDWQRGGARAAQSEFWSPIQPARLHNHPTLLCPAGAGFSSCSSAESPQRTGHRVWNALAVARCGVPCCRPPPQHHCPNPSCAHELPAVRPTHYRWASGFGRCESKGESGGSALKGGGYREKRGFGAAGKRSERARGGLKGSPVLGRAGCTQIRGASWMVHAFVQWQAWGADDAGVAGGLPVAIIGKRHGGAGAAADGWQPGSGRRRRALLLLRAAVRLLLLLLPILHRRLKGRGRGAAACGGGNAGQAARRGGAHGGRCRPAAHLASHVPHRQARTSRPRPDRGTSSPSREGRCSPAQERVSGRKTKGSRRAQAPPP